MWKRKELCGISSSWELPCSAPKVGEFQWIWGCGAHSAHLHQNVLVLGMCLWFPWGWERAQCPGRDPGKHSQLLLVFPAEHSHLCPAFLSFFEALLCIPSSDSPPGLAGISPQRPWESRDAQLVRQRVGQSQMCHEQAIPNPAASSSSSGSALGSFPVFPASKPGSYRDPGGFWGPFGALTQLCAPGAISREGLQDAEQLCSCSSQHSWDL